MSKAAQRLLSKAVAGGSLKPLTAAGLDEQHFPDPKDRDVFRSLTAAQQRYGKLPSPSQLKMDFPEYPLVKVADEFDLLIDKVKYEYTGTVLSMTINAAAEGYEKGNFDLATDSIRAGLSSLESTNVATLRTVDLLTLAEKWEYDRTHAKAGIPIGVPEIDEETGGIGEDQLVTIIGPPGSGKSGHMLSYAIAASEANYRALLITIEMSDEHHYKRAVANLSGVPYKTIHRGQPDSRQQASIAKTLQYLHDHDCLHVQEVPADMASLATIKEQIDKYAPDIVFIDGAYLMQLPNVRRDAAQWERLSALTREMKAIVLKDHRRIVLSTQASVNKMQGKEVTAASTAFSQSFLQDSDIMLGIQPDAELQDRQLLKILKFRDGRKIDVHIEWDWGVYRMRQVVDHSAEGDNIPDSF